MASKRQAKLLEGFFDSGPADIQIGIVRDGPHPNYDGTVAELAAIHEFTGRSWLRGWVDERQDFIRETLGEALSRALITGRERHELEFAKRKLVLDLKQRILRKIPPPLKPATVARKGHDVPLIDTGTLFRAIDGVVSGML